VHIALLSCYKPLFKFHQAEEWLALHGKGSLEQLMRVQIADCLEEQKIKGSLKKLSTIEEETSQAVQAMYEENPYPRWTCVDLPFKIHDGVEVDWLTAGCGTGRPLSQLSVAFPDVKFTAIDLSRSSLGYAVRKTNESSAANIDFYHGDLMNVGNLNKDFDFIESSGVLHHMKDPVAGWKALLACLRPGGRMQIGLYSTKAREVIWKVRDHIKENGYAADLNGIRQLRSEMFDLPNDHPLHPIAERHDFYAASECRDLVFHIQETTYTIPEIRKILDDLDLAFLYFKLDPRQKALYERDYPEDETLANLDNWHALEQKYHQLFAGMYKFFCCRKSDVESPLEKYVILEKTGFLRGY
jgi:SAM-dependent methyltransferase